jgi:iron complex outermembrane recepter protein
MTLKRGPSTAGGCMTANRLMLLGLALAPVCAFAEQVPASGTTNTSTELQEVVVTAQKRTERLQDVPVPVTAVTGDSLLEQNQLRAQDFFSSIPGLNLQYVNGRSNLAIRGITTGPATGNPVVGYTVDDVPFGSSSGLGGLFGIAPDLDPSDLARIEVLRGPQGTLYGASSIGGLVKYVTVDPSTDHLSGTVAADALSVYAGHGPGYNVRGSINIPMGETLAVRASAFTREDPGYIDNVVTGQRGVNKGEVVGARLSALWRPSEALSVKLSALYQDFKSFGASDVDVRLGDLLQSNQFGTGPSEAKNQVYSAIVTDKIGHSELTSVSSYTGSSNYDTLDYSAAGLNLLWPSVYPVGVDPTATVLRQDYTTRKITQEVRITTPILERLDWLVGGFYTHERTPYRITTYATNPSDGTVIGLPILWRDASIFSEYAAFTDLTARFTDQFNVQLGARWSTNTQTLHHHEWTFAEPVNGVASNPTSKDHAVTYLFTPQYKLSPEHMVYARIATGYRPGGPNSACGNQEQGFNVPCKFLSDKTTNYELGAKGDFLSRTLSYDISVYDIDWKDLQVTQVSPEGTFNYNANASRARSRGIELSFESRPFDGLTLTFWSAWTDAQLRQGFSQQVSVYGAAGDRLPYSARFSGRFSVDEEMPLSGAQAFAGTAISYIGNRIGEFVPTAEEVPLRQYYPAYAQADLHAGIKTEAWRVSLFIRNVTDRRGVTGGGYNNQTNFNPYWLNYIQPRTIGVSLERTF